MNAARLLVVLALVVAAIAQTNVQTASCLMRDTEIAPSQISGLVTFTYNNATNLTTVNVNVNGLPANKFLGFHVHAIGNIGSPDGMAAGGHFNPTGMNHSYPIYQSRHVGDLGNLTVDANGVANAQFVVDAIRFAGPSSIIGRGLVIHSGADDGVSQPTGNSGSRWAQCVIGLQSTSAGNVNVAIADATGNKFAVAELTPYQGATFGSDRKLRGRVVFTQNDADVRVQVRICGFQPNTQHAIYLTQFGELNPTANVNNLGSNSVNINTLSANIDGMIDSDFTVSSVTINGTSSIIGRGLVVYETNDPAQATNRALVGVIGTNNVAAALPQCGIEWAACYLKSTNVQASPIVGGTVMIKHLPNDPSGVTIQATITGLIPNTTHGWHVHELGYIGSADGLAVGGHYNPFGNNHGLPNATRHIGDLGNIVADASGTVVINGFYPSDLVKGYYGPSSFIGRAIIIHQGADNGTNPVGFAGARLAQCVVGIANTDNNGNALLTNTAVNDNVNMTTGSYFGACEIQGFNNTVSGRVIFTESTPGVMNIRAQICGVAPNSLHGFHVHTYGDMTGATTITNIGGHYNPTGVAHGYPESAVHHVGDMGNATADANGNIFFDRTINGIQLTRSLSIIGRGVVVHANADNGTDPTGFSGPMIATCVVGITYPSVDFTGVVCNQQPSASPTPTPTGAPQTTAAPPSPTPTTTKSAAVMLPLNIVLMAILAFVLLL